MSQRKSQGRVSQGGSQDTNIVAAAEKAVHFFLAYAGAHNAPVKHADLKKFVFADFPRVEDPLQLARKMLNDSFGYDLQELSAKPKLYVLVNTLRTSEHLILPKFTEGYRTLLALILAYIFMNRAEVEQKNLLKFLQHMNISMDRYHPYFGDVAELIYKQNPTFVKDQFLNLTSTEQGNFYKWGERAKREVDPRAVLEFVCELLGSDINDWKLHLKDCEEEEMETS